MYKTITVNLKELDFKSRGYLEAISHHANSLYNATLYGIKQQWIKDNDSYSEENELYYWNRNDILCPVKLKGFVDANYNKLYHRMKTHEQFKALPAVIGQQTIKSVVESVNSYNSLLREFYKNLKTGKVSQRPGFPRYRKSGGMFQLAIPGGELKGFYSDASYNYLPVPISKEYKGELDGKVFVPYPHWMSREQIKELIIKPTSKGFVAYWSYDDGKVQTEINQELDYSHAIGIDPGLCNWLTVVSTRGKSFIVDGKPLIERIVKYASRVKHIKTGKPEAYWDDELSQLTEDKNKFTRDQVNKAARFLINYCLKHKIGRIIFGRNKSQEQEINIGRKNNNKFTQMPFARLIKRLEELCREYGIKLHVTEESYTSKSSSIDWDFLPVWGAKPGEPGAKPRNWKPSGKRTKRGCYRTKSGELINSDCNGAFNIIRKLAAQLGLVVTEVARGSLALPHRYNLQLMRKKFICA